MDRNNPDNQNNSRDSGTENRFALIIMLPQLVQNVLSPTDLQTALQGCPLFTTWLSSCDKRDTSILRRIGNNRNRETTNHFHWEDFRNDKELHHMLSTLEPKLINTTQKSVESKQGICSSKLNAQQKLHAQKTFEIQKKFHEFLLTHNTFNPSQTRFDKSSNFISYSTIISCLPCSFPSLQNMVQEA